VPAEVAFDYVSDVTRHPEWAANRMSVVALTPGPARVGSRYRTIASQGGKNWESTVEITQHDRPHLFEFIAVGGATGEPADDPHHHIFTFREVAGGTEMELHRRSRGFERRSMFVRLLLRFVATPLGQAIMPRLARNIALSQENIKRRLEAASD